MFELATIQRLSNDEIVRLRTCFDRASSDSDCRTGFATPSFRCNTVPDKGNKSGVARSSTSTMSTLQTTDSIAVLASSFDNSCRCRNDEGIEMEILPSGHDSFEARDDRPHGMICTIFSAQSRKQDSIRLSFTDVFGDDDHHHQHHPGCGYHRRLYSLLPDIHPDDTNKKCLVLDLDETLIHSSVQKPKTGIDYFLIDVPVRTCSTLSSIAGTGSVGSWSPVQFKLKRALAASSSQHVSLFFFSVFSIAEESALFIFTNAQALMIS